MISNMSITDTQAQMMSNQSFQQTIPIFTTAKERQMFNKQIVEKYWLHKSIPTKAYKKNIHEFEIFLVQSINAHSDSIWVARFSPDGLFLATGGKDAVLKIWVVEQGS